MARPRKKVDVVELLRLRLEGASFRDIAATTGLGRVTIHRLPLRSRFVASVPKPQIEAFYD